jgi:UDP-3-O-[3-hydroxymyristoyl] N-acetylglucosamine deacetylase
LSVLETQQHTLAAPAIFAGVGLHSGLHVRVAIRPAPAGAGIVFVRTDLEGDNRIACRGDAVTQTRLNTVIANEAGASVSTIEHLMAAMAALGVDNAIVELDGPEVPIMDGSALPFVQLLDRAGRRRQEASRQYIEVLERIDVIEGDKRASLLPCGQFEIAFEIEFASAAIGRQSVDLAVDEESFRERLADCRTFGFVHEVEALRQAGLARGGSLDNAVVIDGDEILNPEGLRRPDEFVRHKALDAVGDLYVLGHPMLARFEGVKAGHCLNNAVVRALLAQPRSWRLRDLAEELAEAV